MGRETRPGPGPQKSVLEIFENHGMTSGDRLGDVERSESNHVQVRFQLNLKRKAG